MGVLVHARFDDPKETANGVLTLTLSRTGVRMEVNVQLGAVSVTNPDPTSNALPEVDVYENGQVSRIRPSSLSPNVTPMPHGPRLSTPRKRNETTSFALLPPWIGLRQAPLWISSPRCRPSG